MQIYRQPDRVIGDISDHLVHAATEQHRRRQINGVAHVPPPCLNASVDTNSELALMRPVLFDNPTDVLNGIDLSFGDTHCNNGGLY
jgi:hypothetical protein